MAYVLPAVHIGPLPALHAELVSIDTKIILFLRQLMLSFAGGQGPLDPAHLQALELREVVALAQIQGGRAAQTQ